MADRQKKGRTEIQRLEYLKNEKSFLDEKKSSFNSFWRAIICWKKKNLMKIANTSFKFAYPDMHSTLKAMLNTSVRNKSILEFKTKMEVMEILN